MELLQVMLVPRSKLFRVNTITGGGGLSYNKQPFLLTYFASLTSLQAKTDSEKEINLTVTFTDQHEPVY